MTLPKGSVAHRDFFDIKENLTFKQFNSLFILKNFLNNIKPLDIIREIEYNITTNIF